MKLSRKQIENLIALFFLHIGRFPPGTDGTNWKQVKMSDLSLDDPPLPGKPDYEHKKYAELLTLDFNKLGVKMPGLEKQFANDDLTMGELVDYCVANAVPLGDIWE